MPSMHDTAFNQPEATTVCKDILDAFQNLTAEAPGTLREHQNRLAAYEYIRKHLAFLNNRIHMLELDLQNAKAQEFTVKDE